MHIFKNLLSTVVFVMFTLLFIKFFFKFLPYFLLFTGVLLAVRWVLSKFIKRVNPATTEQSNFSNEREVEVKIIDEKMNMHERIKPIKEM